jgi:hydroxymethylbilane synthase
LGIETRKDDAATIAAVAFLDDAATRFAVTAERAALAALGGGCQVPIGIHCRATKEEGSEPWCEIFGVVAAPESGLAIRVHHRAQLAGTDAKKLGQLVAKQLIEAGAGPLLEAVAGGSR